MSFDFIDRAEQPSKARWLVAGFFALMLAFALVATCYRPVVHVLSPENQRRVDSAGKTLCKRTLDPNVRALVCGGKA